MRKLSILLVVLFAIASFAQQSEVKVKPNLAALTPEKIVVGHNPDGTMFFQAARSVTLTWVDGQNVSGSTYTLYRAAAACNPAPTFAKLQSGISGLTFVDSTVVIGSTYCYVATAVDPSLRESGQSNLAGAAIGPFAPKSLSAVPN